MIRILRKFDFTLRKWRERRELRTLEVNLAAYCVAVLREDEDAVVRFRYRVEASHRRLKRLWRL